MHRKFEFPTIAGLAPLPVGSLKVVQGLKINELQFDERDSFRIKMLDVHEEERAQKDIFQVWKSLQAFHDDLMNVISADLDGHEHNWEHLKDLPPEAIPYDTQKLSCVAAARKAFGDHPPPDRDISSSYYSSLRKFVSGYLFSPKWDVTEARGAERRILEVQYFVPGSSSRLSSTN